MSEQAPTNRDRTGKARKKTQVRIASDAEVAALAEDLRSYQGDSAHAQSLRQRLTDIGQIRTKTDDPAVLAIRKAATLKRGKPIDSDFGIDSGDKPPSDIDAARLAFQAPFLGIEPDKAAAYHDPLTINDASSTDWARYMAAYPVVPDERMRSFLKELLGVRPRVMWMPAAEALAAFASRGDQPCKDALIELGERFGFLIGQTENAPADSGNGNGTKTQVENPSGRDKHLYRHTRYALSCWIALSEPPHAPPPRRHEIPMARLPKDDTDASIELLCLAGRLRSARERTELLPLVQPQFDQLKSASIVEEAARFLYQVLAEHEAPDPPQTEALNAVARFLAEPTWLMEDVVPSFDQLLSWLESIRLLQPRDTDLFTRLCGRYPGFRLLLQFDVCPPTQLKVTAAALERLNLVLVPARFATMPPLDKVLCVAELTTLLNHRDLRDLPWKALVAASDGSGQRLSIRDGSIAQAALPDIITWLIHLYEPSAYPTANWFRPGELTHYLPIHLLRDHIAPENVIIALARSQHPQLATRVAVQAERLLRQFSNDRSAQLRFLWRLLEVDPLRDVFSELLEDLRGGDSTLRALVEAILQMDDACSKSAKKTSTKDDGEKDRLSAYKGLVDAAKLHVQSNDPTQPTEAESLLSAACASTILLTDAIDSKPPPDLGDFCQTLSLALRGKKEGDTQSVGLADWFDWVDQPPGADSSAMDASEQSTPTLRAASLKELAQELGDASKPLRGTPDPAWSPAALERVKEICSQLQTHLQGAPLPDRIGPEEVLGLICERVDEQLHRIEKQKAVADRLSVWVESRDAGRLARWIEEKRPNDSDESSDAEAVNDQPTEPGKVDPVLDLANIRPALLESIHQVLRDSGIKAYEEAAEELRKTCADRTHARLPPMVRVYIRQRRTDRILETADEILKTADSDEARKLDTKTLSQMNDYLLERLYFRRAERIRGLIRKSSAPSSGQETTRPTPTTSQGENEQGKIVPRSELVHLSPLLVGMPAGTLLMLDMSNTWNEILLPGHGAAFLTTVIASLCLALLTLVGAVARQTSSDSRSPGIGGRLNWFLGLVWRSLPVFLASWGLAIICSLALLLNLADTAATIVTPSTAPNEIEPSLPRQTLLWSSLSVFLGIFLGLIAQGRGLYGRKGLDDG